MPTVKTEMLTVRLRPEIKAALRQAAVREQRSLTNMLEIMIQHYEGEPLQLGPRAVQTNGVRAG